MCKNEKLEFMSRTQVHTSFSFCDVTSQTKNIMMIQWKVDKITTKHSKISSGNDFST